jgi:tRNA 5-methylaminomethyl-2-thiouridine biosynthesis bifunctional protein
VERQQPPADYLAYVDREQASRIAGWPLAAGGWWFPSSGWVQPPSLCAANLAAAGDLLRYRCRAAVARLEHASGLWQAFSGNGDMLAEAPVVILANGADIGRFPQTAALPVVSARGQVSHLPAAPGGSPRVVVCRLGYVSPEIDGLRCAGASFDVDDPDTQLRAADHAANLEKLEFMLPGFASSTGHTPLAGRVGFRPASPDRLPMVGAVPAVAGVTPGTRAQDIPLRPGMFAVTGFGARGLVWSALAAELLASQLEGEPLPLERSLADAMSPARFLLRPRKATPLED